MSLLAGKRLVIFGCGYLGSAVARAAQGAGMRVEALTRNPEKAETLRAAGLTQVVVADLASDAWHGTIAAGADFVVNTVSSGGPESYRHSYVDGMRSILDWAGQGSVPAGTLLYTSSTSVYPQGGGVIVDETAEAPGGTPNGMIIRESEKLLDVAPAAVRIRHFILRLAGLYGPGRHHLLDQLRAGALTLNGSGEPRLNVAHRDDIVAAILACLQAPAEVTGGVFNVADLAPGTRNEVVRWLSEQIGRAAPGFDGTSTRRRAGAPVPDRIISSAKIQRTLGWRPRYPDFRAGFASLLSP